jgi:hypothetical protein
MQDPQSRTESMQGIDTYAWRDLCCSILPLLQCRAHKLTCNAECKPRMGLFQRGNHLAFCCGAGLEPKLDSFNSVVIGGLTMVGCSTYLLALASLIAGHHQLNIIVVDEQA